MPTIQITCEDCGAQRRTNYRNTKFCRECRLLRNLSFNFRERACASCKEKFLPINRNDRYCGDHTPPESQLDVDCAFCGNEDISVLDELKVCSSCARNPIHRRQFIRALKQRQKERIDGQPRAV